VQTLTRLLNLPEPAFAAKIRLPLIALFGISLTWTITSVKPVSAAGVVGNGTPASCTEAALETALAGGGNVGFNCGSSPTTILVTREKVIAANTVIDGSTNGKNLITLSGGGKARIFSTKNNVELTVRNLTVANGFTTNDGGAIYNGFRGKLTINNCKFNNNVSTKAGEFSGGGAIATQSESTIIIRNSTFTGNKAGNGGAINNVLSDLEVTNSTFTGNQSVRSGSGGGGGAIYIDGAKANNGKIIIRASTFTNNTAVFQGGAIFNQLYNTSTTTIQNSTLSGNRVTGTGNQGFGGGIFASSNSPNGVLTVANTTLSGNTASNQGGGLWSGNNATVTIINSTVFGNQAVSADGKGGLGGGIMRANGNINITNSTIAGNSAGFQGGGIVGGTATKVTNVIIANNIAKNGGNNWNIKNNCFDPLSNGGNNLQFAPTNPNDKECGAGITTANPLLGSLANNGGSGSTQTLALLAGSPAINAGNNSVCPKTDQRGVARPQGGVCDIGAYEAK
jgi:parallel beta-helix repeat protein